MLRACAKINKGLQVVKENSPTASFASIYQNHIMFAKDFSNKIFSPPRHKDTKLKYNKQFFFVS